jgi:hypothetical protein
MRAIAWLASGITGANRCHTCGMRGHTSSSTRHPAARSRSAMRIVARDLVASHLDERRRQPGCIAIERRSIRRARIGAPKIAGGEFFGTIGIQHRVGYGVFPDRGPGERKIGPGRERDSGGGEGPSFVTQPQQQRKRKTPARGIAHDGNPTWVGAVRQEPTIARDRVIERGRERMLRCEPIVDRQHLGAGRRGDTPRQMTIKRGRAGHIPASVEK